MEHLLSYGLELAEQAGAEYAELMLMDTDSTNFSVKVGNAEKSSTSTSGLFARVLVAGRWGFASCPAGGKATIKKLITAALTSAQFKPRPIRPVNLGPGHPFGDQWQGPALIDPFSVPSAEVLELLLEADAEMASAGVSGRVAELSFRRDHSIYLNSEGSQLVQTKTISGGGIRAWLLADGELVQRSWPGPQGSYASAGYEYIQQLDLPGNARRIAREAVALANAPLCPQGITDVVLSGSMLAAQLLYTCGHRARLGAPGAIPPERMESTRMGSALLNLSGDATWPGGAGSFGYDWEGVKAQPFDIIRDGLFVDYFSGREQAASIGRVSTGSMRAPSWQHSPLPWPSNLVLKPGVGGSLSTLVRGIEKGILLDSFYAFAPGPNLQGFFAKAELGWLIEMGQVRHMVRSPLYKGYSSAFWGGCDAIAGSEEQQQLGLMDSGMPVGCIVVPVRIRGVKVGAGL